MSRGVRSPTPPPFIHTHVLAVKHIVLTFRLDHQLLMDGHLMDGRSDGGKNRWTDGRYDKRMDGRVDERTDGRVDERTDGRVDERTDGLTF